MLALQSKLRGYLLPGCRNHLKATISQPVLDGKKGGILPLATAARAISQSKRMRGEGQRKREAKDRRTAKEKTKIIDKKKGRKEDSWKEGRTQGRMEGE